MTSDFHEYWELIPDSEKYESIGQEIVRYKRNLNDSETSARDLSDNVITFLQEHLLEYPYPTHNIIYHIIDLKESDNKNQLLEEIILNTIVHLIELIIENPQQLDKKFKLLNLLSNAYVSEYNMQKINGIVVPALYDLKENRGLLDDELYFALLSRTSISVLSQYLEYEQRQQLLGSFSNKSLFLRCHYQQRHWIESVLNADNDQHIKDNLNEKLYNNITLFRLLLKLENVNEFLPSQWISEYEQIDKSVIDSEVLRLCMDEMSRQEAIFKALNTMLSNSRIEIDTSKSHLMAQLLNLTPNSFKMENYDKILALLKLNHERNLFQCEKFQATPSHETKTEMQLLNEYMIVKMYLNIIVNSPSQESVDMSLSHIRSLLKTINDGNVLLRLLQTVFTLLFIRYEHVKKTKLKRRGSEPTSSSPQNNSTEISDNFINDSNGSGFFCNKQNLEAILNSMRLFLMSLDITEAYKNSDISLREKFTKVLKNVDYALWRLRIVSEKEQNSTQKNYSTREWLSFHETDNENLAKLTSDEEKDLPKRKVVKKRVKRRSRMITISSDNDEDSDNNHFLTPSTFSENRVRSLESQDMRSESIIPKVLMNAESLVALCLMKKDFQDKAESIIKEFNLDDTCIASEVRFMTNFKNTVKNLEAIAKKYEEIYDETKDIPDSDCQEIKTYAEAGFQVAKMIDTIENFCDSNANQKHFLENEHFIEKIQSTNFWMFRKDFVIISSLIDLMLSIPSQFELNQNIFKFIIKKFNFESKNDDYFISFMKKIMTISKNFHKQGKSMSISDIFNNETLSLDPSKFALEQENRRNMKWMFELNDETDLNDEPTLLEVIQKMQLFKSDVNYIDRVVNYVRNVHLMTKFKTNEFFKINEVLTKLNIANVIGKIIFVNQHNPEMLTNFAYNSNINLLHSIALAGAGEILPPNSRSHKEEEKLLSLFHLRQIGSESVEPFDGNDETKGNFYIIKNTDILYYVKRSSFLVAYLIKDVQNFDYQTLRYDDDMNFYERLKKLSSVDAMKSLFDENVALTTLHYDSLHLKELFEKIDKMELNEKLRILACVSERNWRKNKVQFDELRDSYLGMLIEKEPQNIIKLLNEIGSVRKFSQLLLKHVDKIEDEEEVEKLFGWCSCVENWKHLGESEKSEIDTFKHKLKVYREILEMFKNDKNTTEKEINWIKIKKLAEVNICILINYLLNMNPNLKLCHELLKLHPMQNNSNEVLKMYIEALNRRELNDQHKLLIEIIHTLPSKVLLDFFDKALNSINNLPSMTEILKHLNTHVPNNTAKNQLRLQKFQISCKIIEKLGIDDLQLWSLAAYPLIIIEQLLMYAKIESLNVIIKELREILVNEPSCNVCSNTSKNYELGETTLVYDYDPYHKNMRISTDCIDFLLKIYAAKALDFQIVEYNSNLSEATSLDSSQTSKAFQMPKAAPPKDKWIHDDEAKVCMCCKKSKFSLLNRRHHCRRCGRVVCKECSSQFIFLPELYNTLKVRCCNDCFTQIENENQRAELGSVEKTSSLVGGEMEWRLTGDMTNDQMVRDDFTFECSPNVGLCIAITCLHSVNDELTKFLLFHCHRLELLLRPINNRINPEIDVVLVAKMLKYLATTAKLFGDFGESNIVIEHADMILKVAENECDAIISKVAFNSTINISTSIRDTINELIKAENWKLALDISVKFDRTATSSVFSAWAVSLIKGGQYKLAREKMALALQPVTGSSSIMNEELMTMISSNGAIEPLKFKYKRPLRSSPLLIEVIEVLSSTASRKNVMDQSMTSSISSRATPIKEGAKNLTLSMDNLKKIADGDYGQMTRKISQKFEWQTSCELLKSPYYEESLFYLISYAANNDIIEFFMKNNLIRNAVRYAIIQHVTYEIFIQQIFAPITRTGKLGDFMELVRHIHITHWRNYAVAICKFLERKKSLHVLYQIQLLTDDLIRASMTSIKFYLDGSGNYSELHEKARHLNDAKNHLQTELERVEGNVKSDLSGIQLRWDIKAINAQINVILLQLEVSKFLANCEADGLATLDVMPKVFMDKISLKTLLGKSHEMNQVVILLLICGRTICGAFGLGYRIIQECSLNAMKIYTTCTKFFARDINRLLEVENLITCIKTNSSSADSDETEKMCDELVALAVEIAYTQHQANAKTQIDRLIKLISSKTMKIQCYINSNQLKTAFVNCASMNDLDYIKRIKRQAEVTRQDNIRRLCEKKLKQCERQMEKSVTATSMTTSMSGGSTVSSTSDISNLN